MPKGSLVSKEVVALAGRLLLENEHLTGKELQAAIEDRIKGVHYEVRTYQSIKKKLEPVVTKIIAKGLDSPWHLGLMRDAEYSGIGPEAARYILLTQDFCASHEKPPFGEKFPPITARQALWISRLYEIIMWRYAPDIGDLKKNDDRLKACRDLWRWSNAYAQIEIICDLSGTPFNTVELDKAIREGKTLTHDVRLDHDSLVELDKAIREGKTPVVTTVLVDGVPTMISPVYLTQSRQKD